MKITLLLTAHWEASARACHYFLLESSTRPVAAYATNELTALVLVVTKLKATVMAGIAELAIIVVTVRSHALHVVPASWLHSISRCKRLSFHVALNRLCKPLKQPSDLSDELNSSHPGGVAYRRGIDLLMTPLIILSFSLPTPGPQLFRSSQSLP